MPNAGPFEPEAAHWYSVDDRREQLRQYSDLCSSLAALYAERERDVARAYESIAARAGTLCAGDNFDQTSLNDLANALPDKPPWLHPKFVDYQMPREAWQEVVAAKRSQVDRVALTLRSLATYDDA